MRRSTQELLQATTGLRFRHAQQTGECVGLLLQLAVGLPPWWRWTISLAVAQTIERAILPFPEGQ